MRRVFFIAALALFASLPAAAQDAVKARVSKYFGEWYPLCPGTRVTATAVPEIAIPGYAAYRVERTCEKKHRNEMSVTLVDAAKDEVFVGEILHSDERRGQPFSAEADVPVLEAALREAYGVPASVELDAAGTGPLRPIRVRLTQAEDAIATLPGFVSADGASVLLGRFRPLGVSPAKLRRDLLAESPGVRPQKGQFFVTAFIDFQCERCRQRTPRIRDFVWTRGGAVEVRFFPLVKIHDWAYAAAESAAALANVSPALYANYEQVLFPQAASMTPAAARALAADVAEAAGSRDAFQAELSSGRARDRVLRDIELAMSLNLNNTPVFFDDGVSLTGEAGVAEAAIGARLESRTPAPARGARP